MALLAVPFALTSCDDDDWYYDDYWNGYYPDNDNNGSEADQMVAVLSGRWQGDMVYTYTDDNAKPGEKKRVSEKYAVEMTFYRSEDAKDRYAGQGVEVDRNDQGDTQALNFTWWIDTRNGDIYVKYTDSNTIFRMDAASTDYGYHLGWETSRNADTFFGYLYRPGARRDTTEGKGRHGDHTARHAKLRQHGRSMDTDMDADQQQGVPPPLTCPTRLGKETKP